MSQRGRGGNSEALTHPRAGYERPQDAEVIALKKFEEEVGGRGSLVEHLAHASLSADQELLVGLIADPRNDKKSLATIAKLAGVTYGGLIKFFQEAGFVKAQLAAFEKIWKKLPEVAGDVMEKATRRVVPCVTCEGGGQLSYEVKLPGWKKGDEVGEEIKACWNCLGKGEVVLEPEHEVQKTALQLGRLLQPGGVQVGVQVNTQTNLHGLGADALRDFRESSDRILFPTRRRGGEAAAAEEDEVEAEVVSPEGD